MKNSTEENNVEYRETEVREKGKRGQKEGEREKEEGVEVRVRER